MTDYVHEYVSDLQDPRLWGQQDCVSDARVFEVYVNAIAALFEDAYMRRRGELRKHKTFQRSPWQERDKLWGRVLACEELLPELRNLEASLEDIYAEAEEAAWEWAKAKNALGEVIASAA